MKVVLTVLLEMVWTGIWTPFTISALALSWAVILGVAIVRICPLVSDAASAAEIMLVPRAPVVRPRTVFAGPLKSLVARLNGSPGPIWFWFWLLLPAPLPVPVPVPPLVDVPGPPIVLPARRPGAVSN